MRKKFNWDRYEENKIWVHIKTKEEFFDYMAEARARNCNYLEYKEDSFLHYNATYFCDGGFMSEERKKSYLNECSMEFAEWSDYMEKQEKTLKEKYLVSGNVIETRGRGIYLLVARGDKLITYNLKDTNSYLSVNCKNAYNNNLCSSYGLKAFDIMKVFLSDVTINDCTKKNMTLLWEREEKMTTKEVCNALAGLYDIDGLSATERKALDAAITQLEEHDASSVKDKAVDYDAWEC